MSKTKKSSVSSVEARRKKLELEAAEQKARIRMELIDKRLEAEIAELNNDYSPHSSEAASIVSKRSEVAKWVERSQQELESRPVTERNEGLEGPGLPCPLALQNDASTDGPIHQLANVLKDFLTTSISEKQNSKLLSRISTPKDLPLFTGDAMEWLQFKMAYEESTRLCQFSDSENLWRLRKCLRGAAKDAVQALLITATSPEVLMSTLELQFGNPDIILHRIKQEIKKLSSVAPEYHKDIVMFSNKIKNYVAAVLALNRENHLEDSSVITVVLSKLPTILLSKWADYRYSHNTASTTTRLDQLSDFLNEEAIKISQCSVMLINAPRDNFKRKYTDNNINAKTILLQSEQSYTKCRYCHGSNHNLTDCKKFKKSLRKDRWSYVKRSGLCYKCLLRHHDKQMCPAPACDIDNCGETHHRLLHFVPNNRGTSSDNPVVEEPPETENTETQVVTRIDCTSESVVLVKVVPISVHGPNGTIINTTAVLDDGTSVSMITAGLAARAGLQGRRKYMHARGAWNNAELSCETQLIDNITVSNCDKKLFTLSARSVNELDLPTQNMNLVNCEKFAHVQKYKKYLSNGQYKKPEILIGQDNYHLILPLEIIGGSTYDEPYVTRTPLGYCLHGRVPSGVTSSHRALFTTLHLTTYDDDADVTENNRLLNELHEKVRRNFAVDSMGISTKPRLNSEDERARELLEQTSTLVDGKWHVGLPWKDVNCVMPDSFPLAMSRLKNVEHKMSKNSAFKQRYMERFEHLFENNYAHELLDTQVTPKTWYLGHFGVDNPNKSKLRLVFDGAATTNGFSLNDYLLKGPDLLMSLFGIMLRFREHPIAISGDIKDMFLRIKIRPEDQNAFRFLYRKEPEEPVRTYVMSSLVFGACCSPFIAQFIKNKNAQRFESSYPSATEAIYKQHYMDDWIDSVPDEETAIKLIREVKMIHKQGNFEIRNFMCNSPAVLDSLPKEALGETAVKFKTGEHYDGERTLGLLWRPDDDTLGFDVSFKKIPESIINGQQRPTKRAMLRVVMSIFDVYGFLSPITIIGKLIIRDTWRLNISWDQGVPDDIYDEWCKWTNLLKSLENVRLPRYYNDAAATSPASVTHTEQLLGGDAPGPALSLSAPAPPLQLNENNKYTNLQLHLFCDSSSIAMCAVAYWRWECNGLIHVAFIASRSRVMPTKTLSIPRAELQAAVLSARLADTITKEHKIKAERRTFWSDSSCTLHWIRNAARTYKPYIAHRLGEIDEMTLISEWRYVPTKLNIADLGTRKNYDCCILENEWLHGPTFLRRDECDWPTDVLNPEIKNTADLECVNIIQNNEIDLPVPDPTRFSSWLRLLRSTNMVLTFINKCRKHTVEKDVTMERAESLILRTSQAESFGQEVSDLKQGKHINKNSKILTLSPFLDEYGVLRAAGRIDEAADVSPAMRRPAILDGQNYTARLIVKHYHTSAAHGYQELVVNNIKQKYWITKLRPTVKNVVSKCMTCRLKKCKPEIPRMGDLPSARLAHHQRPFTFCGVDLFGPMEVTIGRRREKRYGVLFTCLTVRAIHLETVASLTSDSFIMALRRMAARRGWPQQLFSDNGTNLRGADTELRRSIQELDEEKLKDGAMNHGAKWTFIPPASPHWGGAWERLIRSVKVSLKTILKERAPREETLNSLLAEVESIVNSRPLTHVSVEPNSQETLTPNHFLVGTSSNLPHMGAFDGSELFLRKQWRIAQLLADQYWKRWVREVLPDLVPRKKWQAEQRPLQVGDLVLIVDPDGPRNVWPRGLVQEVIPGRDGRVRMVRIKTRTGILTRSATRVAHLPIGNECC
ncbi:uncharacterized protein LOC134755462 [Cydia strobilella]|uniref:uncharacterized protein LOC134755462 n=1 Tax=Cydia strobilella TaxID=1100964 RepID=UPI0030063205